MLHWRNHLREFILLAILLVLLSSLGYLGRGYEFSQIVDYFKAHAAIGAVVYVAYFVLSNIVITLPIFPLWPVVLYVYPYPVAVALSLLGMIIGSTVDFWLARRLGHDVVIKMLGRKLYEEIEHLINVEDSKTFLFVRLLGNNYFDPISYLAGLSKMPYGRFIVITSVTSAIWLSVILFVINKFSGLNQASSLFSVMGIYGGVILTGMIIWKFFHSRHFSLPTRPKGERR